MRVLSNGQIVSEEMYARLQEFQKFINKVSFDFAVNYVDVSKTNMSELDELLKENNIEKKP